MRIKSYIKRPHSASTPWSVPDLYKAYGGGTGAAGGGAIYIVELGGGVNEADTAAAFAAMNLPAPTITHLSADGATVNSPGGDADGEVALDIQVSGGVYAAATGRAANIVVVWGSDIAECVTFARQHAGTDILIFAAAGDNDSADGGQTPANVDCPASCPSVIGCGGTFKQKAGIETVWNDNPGRSDGEGTGGGYSVMFPAQDWQIGVPTPPRGHRGKHLGRMVPDVAGVADPATGYEVVLNGSSQAFGGTSAVAPFYAGTFAALGRNVCSISWGADEMVWEQQQAGSCQAMEDAARAAVGSLSSVVQTLWQNPKVFADITHGDNGFYRAAVGPDPCSGLGVPNITAIMRLLLATDVAQSETPHRHHPRHAA